MLRNKNIFYFVILIILAVIIYFFVFNKEEGSYKESDKEFAVKDTGTIGKIFIADMLGNKVTLTRTQKNWQVNDLYSARPESITTLLRTIAQLQVNVPVANSMYETVVKNMSAENIKIEIYNLRGEKIKCYFIGKPSVNYNGNFALMEGSEVPFVINIPGFDGFISSRYSTDLLDWKNRSVFNVKRNNISEIKIEYPAIPDSSCIIRRNEDNTFSLNKPKYNPEITNYFAAQFENINCENFIPDQYKLDSLLQASPVCIITVKNTQQESQSIKIYYRPVTYRTKLQFTYDNKEINFDVDKFYGVMNEDKDLAVIQNFVFGKLFVGPQYFARQKPTNTNVLLNTLQENIRK